MLVRMMRMRKYVVIEANCSDDDDDDDVDDASAPARYG